MHDIYLGEMEGHHLFACIVDEKYHNDPEYRGDRYGKEDSSFLPSMPSCSCSPRAMLRRKMGWSGNVKDDVEDPRILCLYNASKDETRKYVLKKRPVSAGHQEKYLDTDDLEKRFLESRATHTGAARDGPHDAVISNHKQVLAAFLLFLEIEMDIKMDPETESLMSPEELKELTPEKKEKYLERMMRDEKGSRTFVEKYMNLMERSVTNYQKSQILNQASNLQWHDDDDSSSKTKDEQSSKKKKGGLLSRWVWYF
jgi:hypothetical protein